MEVGQLLSVALEVGEKNLKCMELLDRANTESYGNPTPVKVPLTIEKGPFIVISGHDLKDLELLIDSRQRKRNKYIYSWRNASCTWLSGIEEISSFKGKFWDGMAESAEGIR